MKRRRKKRTIGTLNTNGVELRLFVALNCLETHTSQSVTPTLLTGAHFVVHEQCLES